MKKAVLIAAMFCGVVSLSSCCRIVDCCFEDPCAPSSCNPCEVIRKKERSCGGNACGSYVPSCSNPCGSTECNSQSPQVKGCTSPDGRCKQ
ncbi:9K cysteine-rich outer membrane protein [Chlamydia pneumoniae TW-183]|uniref:Small cysteine-rich outer membrane protein OmcA n=2 Tax=Chlamydia pneumoniae TaxID=83558 RepID=OMCA_CHLPN|nr:small cysteine-rich outer membrane protein [Chlamydia pneumoniae]Q9Z7Z5.1 RecName: Full=Small cysteine-rich outer membrane protein OmcA; Short=Small-CRP; AltName: Full=9 kDa cysteine-rich lipoprotein; Short=9KD-CRP; Flags: Precursor [Chlamydia pneumoniae]AAD18698.1 9 kDa-Cysteine-Rich Lipoprotein [Chlamydia pneumoniae CWL029]AAF38066.1 OmcA [Chlamydia pneumoniae AR39]AAP98509.1 9K cysteine-rich outer membrane protein [Chlamydia pneumoniae TW-183]AFR11471.1 9 kDa-cysteine-rich lipoprotein [C